MSKSEYSGLVLGGPAAGRWIEHPAPHYAAIPQVTMEDLADALAKPFKEELTTATRYRHARLMVNREAMSFWVPVQVPVTADGEEARWILRELMRGYQATPESARDRVRAGD